MLMFDAMQCSYPSEHQSGELFNLMKNLTHSVHAVLATGKKMNLNSSLTKTSFEKSPGCTTGCFDVYFGFRKGEVSLSEICISFSTLFNNFLLRLI